MLGPVGEVAVEGDVRVQLVLRLIEVMASCLLEEVRVGKG